ncbi:putative ribonuclease H-like domain-containing protein [Tanacetum coccineum]
MSTSNQQNLADSRANERPLMLERGNYIPWESRFRRFLDNKLKDGERMWNLIQNGPYVRPMIHNPDDTTKPILEPLSKITAGNTSQYIADVKVMKYLLQDIPNDIYNSVDTCKDAKEMWERSKRLMFGFNVNSYVRHSRLMDEFDKFAAKERESLESVYERLTTLVNIMDLQFEPHVLASKAKKAAKNHDPLALLVHSNASSSQSHANSSYSPQPYYVTHPSSVDGQVDIQTKNEGYGGNGNKNAGRQNLNQAFNAGTGNDERNQIVQRVPRTESTPGKANVQCYNCNEKGHYAHDSQKPRVHDSKYFREHMLLAMKDEAGSNLSNEENDFLLDNSYKEETMEELTAAVMLMARIQPADGNTETVPSYEAKAVSEVNASSKVHEQVSHVKRKTIIQTSDDDQIDSNIMFDDPYVENNGGTSDHDSNAHDEYYEIQILAYNVNRFKQSHMLRKTPNKVYDPFIKAGLGYKNPECLKKVIAAQPKMYDGEMLHSAKLNLDSPDSEETLKDAEESRLKMRNKMNLKELKEELIEEVHEMINIFDSMEQKVNRKSSKENILQNEIDRILEVSLTSDIRNCVFISVEKQKNKLLKAELEKSSSDSKDIQANLRKRTKIRENDFKRSQAQSIDFELKLQHQKDKMACDVSWKSRLSTINNENILVKAQVDSVVKERENIKLEYQKLLIQYKQHGLNIKKSLMSVESSNSVRRQKSKDTKSKDRVLKNKNDKRPSAHVWKMSSSVSKYSNKRETMHLNEFYYKKSLIHYPIAAKSKNLGATSVVAKSRLTIVKTTTATNKVSSILPLSSDSSQSRTLSNYMKNKIATNTKWKKWFENQQCFNWTPKSKTAQSLPSETKSRIRVCSTSNTPVTTQKWVAKLSTIPFAFISCDAASVAEVPSVSALQKLKRVVSLLEGLQAEKKIALCQKE